MNKMTSSTYRIETHSLLDFEVLTKRVGSRLIVKKIPKGPTLNLPGKIKFDKDLAWVSGFYFAEGSKHKTAIGISNNEHALVIRFRDYINKTFGLTDRAWFLYVTTGNRSSFKNKEDYYDKMFTPRKVTIHYNSKSNKDNAELRINNVPISKIFHNLLNLVATRIMSDKEMSVEFLKGYMVGDGSINLRNGLLHDINITVKNRGMKDLIKKMFYETYGLRFNERYTNNAFELSYCDVTGTAKLILDGYFSEYPHQWEKLIDGYRKKEYTRSHIVYWRTIRKTPLNVMDICKATKRTHWSVRDALNRDENLGLVVSFRKLVGKRYPYKFYKLSDSGVKLLKILESGRYI